MHHREYWRFFQSGQFFHLLAFREMAHKQQFGQRAASILRDAPRDFVPSGFIDFVSTVLTLTEVCLFASRLAANVPYPPEEPVEMRLSMVGVENVVVASWDTFRFDLWEFLRSDQTRIVWEERVARDELLATPEDVALRAAQFFFNNFHWDNQPLPLFRQQQQKLLSRRL